MHFIINKYYLTLLPLLLGGCSSPQSGDSKPFASEHAAAVHFLKPIFPILDCDSVGVVGKGEVDEHFYEVFYAVDKNRSLSIRQEDLEHALFDSSKEEVSYIFTMMDKNLDKVVSTEEFQDFMYTIIDLADTGKNGEITLADLGLEAAKIIRAHER